MNIRFSLNPACPKISSNIKNFEKSKFEFRVFTRPSSHNAVATGICKASILLLLSSYIDCCSSQYSRAVTCDFQQCGILTCVDSIEPVQPPFKLRFSK